MKLPITGEYPPDWKAISDATWAAAGHRCIRCGHPYKKGEFGRGEWSHCDANCRHEGPLAYLFHDGSLGGEFSDDAATVFKTMQSCGVVHAQLVARWRIGTVHHLDGNKSNCSWWNLLALCQRCHLKTQATVDPCVPYFLEHSDWFKPYAAGFYAKKYNGQDITREEAKDRLDELLAWEKRA